ncbi:uncharacterized protein [Mytilus edulis]|uniref:uncharacterized protein n=1 Tax=Mytilus edulis TaxID=6550 RepID=UPI0039EE6E89
MTAITDEEKNYIIIQFLLTGISPFAVRKVFDKEFHPSCLKKSIRKELPNIYQLRKKGFLKQPQIDLLDPKEGHEPSSTQFDVSLMLCLLKNFTDICVYEKTPDPEDTSVAADLSRIKHYRNDFAHLNESILSVESFNSIWTDLTEAIGRLGGINLLRGCHERRQKIENLDERNYICEIFSEMQSDRKEIYRLKEKHRLEKDLLRAEEKERAQLEELSMNKYDIKKNIEMKRKWRDQLSKERFIVSTAALDTFETVLQNRFVAISRVSGSGKSSVAQFIALRMSESHGYFVVSEWQSSCSNFPTMNNYGTTSPKILYLYDDYFGKCSISDHDQFGLNLMFDQMKRIAATNLSCKFLITCRPNTINVSNIKHFLPSIVECDLHSPEMSLSREERQKIFDLYIPDHEEVNGYQNNDCLLSTKQLPLLCTLYRKHFCNSIQDFFLNPDKFLTDKISEMRDSENPSYICLALLLVADELHITSWNNECIKSECYTILQSVITESGFKTTPKSQKLLQAGFESIEEIYVKREENKLLFIHDKMHDNVVSCIGTNFIRSILKHAKYSFIEDRIRLESYKCEDSSPNAVVILNQTYNEQFFKRLLQEISRRNEKVFVHIQNRHPGFRNAFIEYLRIHLTEFCVLEYFKIPLVLSSKLGYEDFVSFIVEKWKEQSRPSFFYQRESPLSVACSMGHINIVKILVESSVGKEYLSRQPTWPIEVACIHGYSNIVELLLTHGIHSDLSTALEYVCKFGHTEIVTLLLKKGTFYHNEPLRIACENGHDEIVRILLRYNLPVNDNYGDGETCTPLYFSSMKGHLNIVKLLLNAEAKVQECDISVAEWNDHEDIAEYLRRHLSLLI